MKVNEFSVKVSKQEGMKKSVDIAQISEILKIANLLLDGQLYASIRKVTEEQPVKSNVRVVNPKNKTVAKKSNTKSKKS